MTTKTITLDHAVAERMSKAIEQDKLFKYNDLQALHAALAKPVPPAGGDIETIGWDGHPGGDLVRLEDHRAHVTRLQAEVGRLTGENNLLRHDVASYMETMGRTCELLSSDLEDAKTAEGKPSDVLFRHAQALQSELTKAEFLVNQALHLQTEHYGDGMGLHLAMIKWAQAANQSAPADNHETHCVLLDPEEPAAECTCKHRFMSLADDPRRCADCDAVEVQEGPADKDEECAHDFRMFSGECHKCGADWIPGKNYAPSLIETLRANGDRIAMEATIAQQAQRIADLEAGKGQGEPVAWADPLAFSNFKAHAHLGGPYDHEWMWAKPAHAGMIPLYRHAEQPAPVAADDCDKALMDRHEAWKAGVASLVMPERKSIRAETAQAAWSFKRGWNACLDEVTRLNGVKP